MERLEEDDTKKIIEVEVLEDKLNTLRNDLNEFLHKFF